MADPLSIAASALAVASVALQLLKKQGKQGTNGYGKAMADMELKITNDRRKEQDEMEEMIRGRMHDLGNRLSDMGLRHEMKLGELDTEIKLLKQLLTRRDE